MTDPAEIQRASDFLQQYLAREKLNEIAAVAAAEVLSRANVLADSGDRPGLPLRRYLRAGLIRGGYQEANGRWFIRRL
jgi:hypothetical protein